MELLQVLYHAFYNTIFFACHNIAVDLILLDLQKYFSLYNVVFLDTLLKTIIHHHHQIQQNQILKHDRHDQLNQENYILAKKPYHYFLIYPIFLFQARDALISYHLRFGKDSGYDCVYQWRKNHTQRRER